MVSKYRHHLISVLLFSFWTIIVHQITIQNLISNLNPSIKMGRVKVCNNDAEYQQEMMEAGSKLTIVDFTASWCGPCQRIAPIFESFSLKYPEAVFLKVDVDACQDTATSQSVSAMPTFILYRNKVKLDRIQGADANALEAKIKQWYANEADPVELPGYMDLKVFILADQCASLNETDETSIKNILTDDSKFIESDCDEQLILSFNFNQRVKIHSLKIKAPSDLGPKSIKLFVNQPRNLDFSSAEQMTALQELELTPKDLTGNLINLRYVKFQNVNSLDVFIQNNQGGGDVTRLDYVGIIGTAISGTNMDDFKRIAGKKGESH